MLRLRLYLNHLKQFAVTSETAQTTPNVNQLRMLRLFHTNEQIVLPALKESYRLFRYSPEYREQFIQLLNSNNELGLWDDNKFATEMMGNLHPGTEILIADGDSLIGACAAFSMKLHEPYAVLAYPAVLPSYRNRGIGTYLIAKTLLNCQLAAYPGVILHTDDFRLPAINCYLKLGFIPDIETKPETKARWHLLLKRMELAPSLER